MILVNKEIFVQASAAENHEVNKLARHFCLVYSSTRKLVY